VPITWSRLEYCAGTNEYVQIDPSLKQQVIELYKTQPMEAASQFGAEPFELKNILKYWVRTKNKELHVIPTDTVYVTIDKEAVRQSGMLMACDSIPDKMVISLKGKSALYKGDLMILEMIAQCNLARPIYVATTVGAENYMNLGEHFVQEGLANRITPFRTFYTDDRGNLIPMEGAKQFDTEKTFDNIMNKYKFGGINKPGIYLDETVMRMCYTHRRLMSNLAMTLVEEGKTEKAKAVLDKCEKEIPDFNVPHDFQGGSLDLARAYHETKQDKKCEQLINKLWTKSMQYLKWYCSLEGSRFESSKHDCMIQVYILGQLLTLQDEIDHKKGEKLDNELAPMLQLYQAKGGSLNDY
jgi:hypothetical protein